MSDKKMYDDYLAIKKLNAGDSAKRKCIELICNQRKESWKVTGVTKNALKIFRKFDYKKTSGMGIERAHLKDRSKFYQILLERDFSFDDWVRYIDESDVTVLASKKENDVNKFSKVTKITEKGLFTNTGFSWKHTRKERDFLRIIGA
jgi:hypothetical protein